MTLWLIMNIIAVWVPLFLFTRYVTFTFLRNYVLFNFIVSLFLTICCFFEIGYLNELVYLPLFNWINIGIIKINVVLLYDTLTVVMVFIVLFISGLVHLYSFSYMRSDPNFFRFISYLSLFTFFMLVLVTSHNFVQLLIGWEGVGLSSYLLICFWYTRIAANLAAIKAMSVNRIGDIFLLFTIFLVFSFFGSVNFGLVFNNIIYLLEFYFDLFFIEIRFIDLLCFFIFLAACGKSAQLLLHIWLPDAMEGPTPVSALIHAATMVTAGVFLVIRCSILFEHSSKILFFMVFVGSFTCFFMSILGAFQQDIKKIVAYSTCSQLGYMFMGCGLSSYNTSFFHLFNHAFFKALLFLSMGVIIHALSDEQDLRKMGNLVNFLPYTIVIVFFGNFALLGLPFLAGFYSKDILIEIAFARFYFDGSFAYFLGLLAAFFTSFYSTRLFLRIFFSYSNFNRYTVSKIHEVDILMFIPLIILLLCSFFVGFFFFDMFIGIGSFFFFDSIFINFINYSGIYIEFESLINVFSLKSGFTCDDFIILNLLPNNNNNDDFIAKFLIAVRKAVLYCVFYLIIKPTHILTLYFYSFWSSIAPLRWLIIRYFTPYYSAPFYHEKIDNFAIFVYFEDLAKLVTFDMEAFNIFLTTVKFGVMEDNIFKETISSDEIKSCLIESNYDIQKCVEVISQNNGKILMKFDVDGCKLYLYLNELFMLFPASYYKNEENILFGLRMRDISFYIQYKDINIGRLARSFGKIGTYETLHTLLKTFGNFDENQNFIKKNLYGDLIAPVVESTLNIDEYYAEVVKTPIFVELNVSSFACTYRDTNQLLFWAHCEPIVVWSGGSNWYKLASLIFSYVTDYFMHLQIWSASLPDWISNRFYFFMEYNFVYNFFYDLFLFFKILKQLVIYFFEKFRENANIYTISRKVAPVLDPILYKFVACIDKILIKIGKFKRWIVDMYNYANYRTHYFFKLKMNIKEYVDKILKWIIGKGPSDNLVRDTEDIRSEDIRSDDLVAFWQKIKDYIDGIIGKGSSDNLVRDTEDIRSEDIRSDDLVAFWQKIKDYIDIIIYKNKDIYEFESKIFPTYNIFIKIMPLIVSFFGFFMYYFLDNRFILYYYNAYYRMFVLKLYNGLFFDKLFIDVLLSKFYFFCYHSFYKNIESSFFQKYNIYIFEKNIFSFYFFFKIFSKGYFFVYILIVLYFIFFYFFLFFIFKFFNISFISLILILFISSFVFKWLILKDYIKNFLINKLKI